MMIPLTNILGLQVHYQFGAKILSGMIIGYEIHKTAYEYARLLILTDSFALHATGRNWGCSISEISLSVNNKGMLFIPEKFHIAEMYNTYKARDPWSVPGKEVTYHQFSLPVDKVLDKDPTRTLIRGPYPKIKSGEIDLLRYY